MASFKFADLRSFKISETGETGKECFRYRFIGDLDANYHLDHKPMQILCDVDFRNYQDIIKLRNWLHDCTKKDLINSIITLCKKDLRSF